MNNFSVNRSGERLESLMNRAEIINLDELSRISGVSVWDISRVEQGLLPKMSIEVLLRLSKALGVSPEDLLNAFIPCSLFPQELLLPLSKSEEISALREEYERLEAKLNNLEADLLEEWQNASLGILESWLIYWPSVIASVTKNPSLPAKKIILLVKPVQELIKNWGLEPIGQVGEQVAYNPQLHQLIEGTAEEKDLVRVRNVGYFKGDRLYLRAKVNK
jgi:transcriptional regulator with XRE-family HTH domain